MRPNRERRFRAPAYASRAAERREAAALARPYIPVRRPQAKGDNSVLCYFYKTHGNFTQGSDCPRRHVGRSKPFPPGMKKKGDAQRGQNRRGTSGGGRNGGEGKRIEAERQNRERGRMQPKVKEDKENSYGAAARVHMHHGMTAGGNGVANANDGQLFVKTMTPGETIAITTNVYNDTLDELRCKIEAKSQVPVPEQDILYKGAHLDGNNALASYGLKYGDTLHLVLRLRGGRPHDAHVWKGPCVLHNARLHRARRNGGQRRTVRGPDNEERRCSGPCGHLPLATA